MSLVLWLPLNGDTRNQGLTNISVSSAGAVVSNNGKTSSCMKIVSTTELTYSPDFNTENLTLCGWFKFNKDEIATVISSLTYTSAATTPTGNIIGNNTYGGIGIVWTGNNYYSSGAFSSMTIMGVLRTPSFSKATGNFNVDFGVWTHISLTWAVSTKTLTLYKNGALVSSVVTSDFSNGVVRALKLNYKAVWGGNGPAANIPIYMNDVRVYDHCLSQKEIKEVSRGLILHYKFDDAYIESTTNLGGTSVDYSNQTYGNAYNASSWGGDKGTVTFYPNGGYNNYPYKVYHKTSGGTGGIYRKTANDITIESGKTYTMSVYVKSDRDFTDSAHSFNINGSSVTNSNHYITAPSNVHFTTEWTRVVRTFTATSAMTGKYGEMSILYNDAVEDYYVYYSGFQIELGDHATPYVIGTRTPVCYDCSGFGNNGTPVGKLTQFSGSPRYDLSTYFGTSNYVRAYRGAMVSDEISVCWWGYMDNWANYGRAVSCTESGGWNFEVGSSKIQFPVHSSGTSLSYTTARDSVNLSSLSSGWHHFVGSYKTGGKVKLYRDGNLVGSATTNGGPIHYHASNGLFIGGEAQGTQTTPTTPYFNGAISDFRIYAVELSEDEVRELYNVSASIDKNGNIFCRELMEV